MIMDPKHLATQAALRHLFGGGHFSICTIDNLSRMNGVVIERDVYQVMHTCHCVNFREMDPRLRAWLFDEAIKAFSAPGIDLSAIDAMRPPTQAVEVIKDAVFQLVPQNRTA